MGQTRKDKTASLIADAVLLHESALDADQSAGVKRDMALVVSLYRAERSAKVLMVAARAVIVAGLLATATLMVLGILHELPAAALAVVGLFATPTLEHVAHEVAKDRAAKLSQVKAIRHISDLYTEYGTGETVSKKITGYISLLTHRTVQLGHDALYTLHLDTSNESNYTIRMFSRSAPTA